MSELKKLLEGVKAQWKSLGEVVKLEKGKQLNKEMLALEGTYPAYNGGISYSGFTERYNYDGNKTIISQGGASAGFVNFIATKFYANAHCYVVLPHVDKVNNRYIYHVLKLNQNKLTKKQFGAGIPALKTADILNIPILIPCPDNPEKSLKIQQEIVRILDRLSEETNQLNVALQKELDLHQKRYDFYREELFKFVGNEVEWRSLAEVFDLKNGYTPSKQNKEYWTNGTVPWFRMEDIRRNGRVLSNSIQHVSESAVKGGRLFPANSIIVATSATIGEYALITVPYLSNQRFTNLSIKNNFADIFIMKFMVHYSYLLGEWCKKNVTVGNFAGVDMGGFKKFPIAIPSLIDQERIVKILDELDAKTQAITTAIQKEIALRNKQYEYYRDRLLSFQSLHAEAEAIQ